MSTIYKRKDSKYYWYENKRFKIRKSTKVTRKRDAKLVQEQWDLNIALGDFSFAKYAQVGGFLIRDYALEYLTFVERHKSENATAIAKLVLQQHFLHFCQRENILFLHEITTKTIDTYTGQLNRANKTKKNHLSELSMMFNYAVRENIIKENPTKYAYKPPTGRKYQLRKNRPLEPIDIDIIFKSAGGWRLYYLMLYHTGLRAGDVALIRNCDVDRKRKVLTTLIRKKDQVHEIPISDAIIRDLPNEISNDPLFPDLYAVKKSSTGETVPDEDRLRTNLKKPREYMQRILKLADRPHATLHCFRHTFNQTISNLGVSADDRKILLTQSATETNLIYSHPDIKRGLQIVNQVPVPPDTKRE